MASDFGTDAKTRDTLYFKGISTNLKTGDTLLLALGNGKDQQVLRTVESVDIQADYKRTEVILTEASLGMTGSGGPNASPDPSGFRHPRPITDGK